MNSWYLFLIFGSWSVPLAIILFLVVMHNGIKDMKEGSNYVFLFSALYLITFIFGVISHYGI